MHPEKKLQKNTFDLVQANYGRQKTELKGAESQIWQILGYRTRDASLTQKSIHCPLGGSSLPPWKCQLGHQRPLWDPCWSIPLWRLHALANLPFSSSLAVVVSPPAGVQTHILQARKNYILLLRVKEGHGAGERQRSESGLGNADIDVSHEVSCVLDIHVVVLRMKWMLPTS